MALLTATAVGAAAFLVGGFEYRLAQTVTVQAPTVTPETLVQLRRALVELTWETLHARNWDWRVLADFPTRRLTVSVSAPNRPAGRQALTGLLGTYRRQLQHQADEQRSRPGPDELILSEIRQRLRTELATMTQRVDELTASQPQEDYLELDGLLHTRLGQEHAVYLEKRRNLRADEARLADLQNAPLPEHPVVTPRIRAQALDQDVELQQDLGALKVQLAEARQALLETARESAPTLEQLQEAVEELTRVCTGEGVSSAGVLRPALHDVAAGVEQYRKLLAHFATTWNARFQRLRELDLDPLRAEVLDLHTDLYDLYGGFVFQAGRGLGALRAQVRHLTTGVGASARHHALTSALTRAFHHVQSAHDRFQFAAAGVKPANSFRLDAALRSAQGLHYRSLRRLHRIEKALATEALRKMRLERRERITARMRQVTQRRAELDEAMDALLAVYQRADQNRPLVRHWLQSTTESNVRAERIARLRQDLRWIDTRLGTLAEQRRTAFDPTRLAVSPCQAERWPANWPAKLTRGLLAAGAAFVGLLALQAWLAPRGHRVGTRRPRL